jgi:hypothetical protein
LLFLKHYNNNNTWIKASLYTYRRNGVKNDIQRLNYGICTKLYLNEKH